MVQADAGQQVPGPARSGRRPVNRMARKHVLQGGKTAQQVEGLEDVADPLRPETVAFGLGEQCDVPVVDRGLCRCQAG